MIFETGVFDWQNKDTSDTRKEGPNFVTTFGGEVYNNGQFIFVIAASGKIRKWDCNETGASVLAIIMAVQFREGPTV